MAEVDLAGEDSKTGIDENDLPDLAEFLQGCKFLKFMGLMIVPPFFEDAEDVRPYFRRLGKFATALPKEVFSRVKRASFRWE